MIKAFSFLFTLIFIGLVLLQCSKDEVSEPVIEEQEKEIKLPGFDYWLNNNEEWYYDYYLPVVPPWASPHRATSYKILRDTLVITDSISITGKIIREITYRFNGNADSNNSQKTDWVMYYIKDKRELIALYPSYLNTGPKFKQYTLANFNNVDHNLGCEGIRMISRDTVLFAGKYFIQYINSKGVIAIEGITLGLSDCSVYPPGFAISGYGQTQSRLELFRYTSDEFTFEWKR